MIDLYTAGTQNGHRAAVMLEESGLAYRAHRLNLAAGEQKKPEYLAINPAGLIPAIVDHDGPGGKPLAVAQSGAIVLYLAEKTGKLLPKDLAQRAIAMQWFMQACTDCAAASGGIFLAANVMPEKSPANVEFFEQRLLRFLGVADARLASHEYLAGELSVADIALYPLVATRMPLVEKSGGLAHLRRWAGAMAARPAVAKGMAVSA
ncbi:MAG: glutathione S-transferase N-terminal domain-containing protein [Burkholderiales bacterium]|jgi:GST-like protein|nr:glutathione S-transferase N-terminal domain-containing protein [Burkholderiales bacterium]